MRFRVLGRTGISVSEIGFGCGSTGGLLVRGERADQLAVVEGVVEAALEGGINYFDTAAAYGLRSERRSGLNSWGHSTSSNPQPSLLREVGRVGKPIPKHVYGRQGP